MRRDMRDYLRGRGIVDSRRDFLEGLQNYDAAARRYDEAAADGNEVPEEIVQNLNSALEEFFLATLSVMNQNIRIFNNEQICIIMNRIEIYDMDTFNQALESFGIEISNQTITDTISRAFTSINQVQEENDVLNTSRASELSFSSDADPIILGEPQEEPQNHENLAASAADENLAASAADRGDDLDESIQNLLINLSSAQATPDSTPARGDGVNFSHRRIRTFQGRNTTV